MGCDRIIKLGHFEYYQHLYLLVTLIISLIAYISAQRWPN